MKDTCNLCDSFNIKIKNKNNNVGNEEYKLEHDRHLLMAKEAREALKRDIMAESKNNLKLEVATYDMEKVLGLPKLPTNLVYYKRQLFVFVAFKSCFRNPSFVEKYLL